MTATTIGIVGLGTIGTMMAEAIQRSGAVLPGQLAVFNRSPEKAGRWKAAYPAVVVADSLTDLARRSQWILICVSPGAVQGVLEEVQRSRCDGSVVISMAANVPLACLATVAGERVGRVIPNVGAMADRGVFLFCPGARLAEEQTVAIADLLGRMGTVYRIPEDQIEVYSDLASCSPGILSRLFELFVEAAHLHGAKDIDLARRVFLDSLAGTVALYRTQNLSPAQVLPKVARKGGVTEVAVGVLDRRLPTVMDELFVQTLENYAGKKRAIEAAFGLPARRGGVDS